MRALIMVLMFLLRWVGSGPSPTDDEVTAPADEPLALSESQQVDRAQRVARGAAGAASHRAVKESVTPPVAGGSDTAAAANRRRALYASALTAAGTAAWVAGRRSGVRR